MKRIFILLFCYTILLQLHVSAQTRLIINPHGHTATIPEAVATNDGKFIITVSHDKSVKVWSTEFGNLVDEFFGERGEGSEGMLYCVAISPDDKYLAVGGYLLLNNNGEATGLIRVYDFQERKLFKTIRGHQNVVHSLAFSPDGKYLASGSGDSRVNVWTTGNFDLYHSFNNHTVTARSVCFGDKNTLYSGGWDGKLNAYDISSKKLKKSIQHKDGIFNVVAYNSNHKLLLAGINGSSKIQLYNEQLEEVDVIELFKPVASLSTKGEKVIAGQEREPYMTSVFEWKEGKFHPSNLNNGLNNTVSACGFINENMVFTTGGEDNEIYLWKSEPLDKEKNVSFVQRGVHIKGMGTKVCAVGYSNGLIAFADADCDASFGKSTLRNFFDLNDNVVYQLPGEYEHYFRGLKTEDGKISVTHEKGGLMDYINGVLVYKKDGEWQWKMTLDNYSGYRHSSYMLAGSKWVISGNDPNIYVYNREGLQVATLKGHQGEVLGLWSDSTGNYIFSSGRDQTIRLWNLTNLKNEQGVMRYDQLYEKSKEFFRKKYPALDFTTPDGMKKLLENVRRDFGEDTAKYLITAQEVYPEMNFFIGKNNEWVIWAQDGYYKSSKEGAKFIGYHINQGFDKEAKYYPFEQFDLKYHRPDIINQRLGIGDSMLNESLKKAHDRRLYKMGLKEEDLSEDKHIPEVKILSKKMNTEDEFFKLEILASDAKYDLHKINIYNNDVPVLGTKGFVITETGKRELKKTFEVPLLPGENKIQVSVVNHKGAESLRETMIVLCTRKVGSGNLYLVTLGVSEYEQKERNLKYAAKDADDISAQFKTAGAFNKVFTKTYTNAQVTRSILPEIKKFLAQAGPNDQVIIFVAGHGVLDDKFDYYFASHDMDFNDPAGKGISYTEIENVLDEIRSLKKILFMDTCHSGEVDKDDIEKDARKDVVKTDVAFRTAGAAVKHKSLDIAQTTELMKEVFSDLRRGTGSNVISSAGGYELAAESNEWNNGLFTYVMLDGIKTMSADLDKDGKIYLSELKKYVGEKVLEKSGGQQKPTSRIENISFDYRVW